MMMESEKPHRSGSSGSELFICFTSRPSSSSSSMKISSKSILSPGRTDKFREPTLSLSSSLSRRLRNNGSMKGGQSSPMFPTGSKKKGCAFENPEPSSPKVTCIGQVRVKTKKQGKKMRTRSKRKGEVSFRKTEQSQEGIHHHQQQQECLPHRNQRWVHLPLTICEALRAFGAEFNCFLPCRSSCSSTSETEKEEKRREENSSATTTTSSCGAVFARWLMALQEGEGKGREIELVVGEEERREEREVIDEIEIEIDEEKGEVKEEKEEDEEARVSICIPPRNALLLMRCRSEPLRMSSLANRFWDSPVPKEDPDDDEGDEDDDENEEELGDLEEGEEEDEEKAELETKPKEEEMSEKWVLVEAIEEQENPQEEANCPTVENQEAEERQEENPEKQEEQQEQEEEIEVEQTVAAEEEIMVSECSPEAVGELENPENESELQERVAEEEEEKDEERESSSSSSPVSVHPEGEQETEPEPEPEAKAVAVAVAVGEETAAVEEREEESTEEKETEERFSEEEMGTEATRSATDQQYQIHEDEEKSKERENEDQKQEQERESAALPDCLLLMMCEPKLSMEVSKETWVCSTDFIRWRPEKPVIQKDGGDESKKRVSTDSNPAHQQPQPQQPPRSSCSNPAPAVPPSMATMIEQKLVNAVAYEPFVLTRCKSEPMRTSAKLSPEACFWNNRKLEPHRPTTLGVGAARIGV